MGFRVLAPHVIMLVFCTAHVPAVPKHFMDNYIDNSVDAGIHSDSKMMKAMAYELDQVKQEYQEMKSELSRTNILVEELKNELHNLKSVVMDRDAGLDYMNFAETKGQPSAMEVVEEYDRSTDWTALKEGLEKLLDRSSVEYHQLEDISDHGWGRLWQVGNKGAEELARLLMDAGLPANKTDDVGDTMLHGAAEGGRIQMAQVLLEHGADVDSRGWRGLTPFNKAALGGKPEMAKWLADRGADVRSADDDGMTSLHFAAEHGHLSVVRLLLELGLDASVKDKHGWTALDWAQRTGHTAVAEFLSNYPH